MLLILSPCIFADGAQVSKMDSVGLLDLLYLLQLPEIEQKMKEANQTILTPLISLDTPGKATVQVVILADPVCNKACHWFIL